LKSLYSFPQLQFSHRSLVWDPPLQYRHNSQGKNRQCHSTTSLQEAGSRCKESRVQVVIKHCSQYCPDF
jgi:hypothetical protein